MSATVILQMRCIELDTFVAWFETFDFLTSCSCCCYCRQEERVLREHVDFNVKVKAKHTTP